MKTLLTNFACLLFICFSSTLYASLLCPDDVTVTCDSDLSDSKTTGTPILFGQHVHYTPSYEDIHFTNPCGVGYIDRKWYIDINYSQTLDNNEPFCRQTITLTDIDVPITFNPPMDLTLDCNDNIPNSKVTWSAGPCDFIGVDSKDYLFDVDDDSCYKILRKHTVIDWCAYDPNDPNWNGEGLYEFKQYIEIIDNLAPKIEQCAKQTFYLNADCEAEVILTNSAVDLGDCPSAKLSWEAEIDLWADGTIDEVYSYLKTGDLNIKITANAGIVEVKLKEKLGPGNHKIKWKVKDGCGNWKSCLSTFETVDNKPPTPYCLDGITVGLDGWYDGEVTIEALKFDIGSFDNCSPQEKIHFAFSSDPLDTLKTFDCISTGFQPLSIYSFDKKGNSDFCMVSFLVLDNGSCGFRFAPTGNLIDINQNNLSGVNMKVERSGSQIGNWISNAEGLVEMMDIPHYDDITFTPTKLGLNALEIDIEDFQLLTNHLLYKSELIGLSTLAGDLDNNKRLTPNDLKELRDVILGRKSHFADTDWAFINKSRTADFELKQHDGFLQILDFTGSVDFIGIMKGDLNNTHLDSLDNRNTELWTLDARLNEAGQYDIYIQENQSVSGLQLNINASGLTNVIDGQLTFNSDNHHLSANDLTVLDLNVTSLSSELPLFSIDATGVQQLTGKAVISDNEYAQLVLRSMNQSALSISPNPTTGIIRFDRPIALDFELIDLMGRKHNCERVSPYSLNVDNLPNGKYFIREIGVTSDVSSFIKIGN